MGQTTEDTDWRGKAKGQWRAMEQAAVRRGCTKDMERGKVHAWPGLNKAGELGEGEPWLLLAMFDHTSITIY